MATRARQWRENSSIRSFAGWGVALCLAVVLTACSAVRVGYNWLPTAVNWRLASFVTFTPEQQTAVDEHLVSLLEWHRRTQLPDYLAFLRSVGAHPALAAAAGGMRPVNLTDPAAARITTADLRAWRERALAAWPPLADRLAGPVAGIAATLTPDQIAGIRAEIENRHARWRARHVAVDENERQALRLERWEDRIEWLFGELRPHQRATLAQQLPGMADSAPWWQARHRWQHAFVDLLADIAREQPPADEAARRVRVHLQAWLEPGGEQVRALRETMTEETDRLLVELLAQADPAQWDHARERVQGLIDDLSQLTGR